MPWGLPLRRAVEKFRHRSGSGSGSGETILSCLSLEFDVSRKHEAGSYGGLAGESGRRSGAVIESGSGQNQTYLLVDLVLHIERLIIREQCRCSSRVYKHNIVVATPTTFANKGDQPRKAFA